MRTPTNYFPAMGLRDYILSYGILEIPTSVDEPYFSPPIGLSGFIIHTVNTRNTIVARIENRDHYTAEAVASGQVTCPVHGRYVGGARILMVFFRPLGMHELFGTNMATLTNTSMPLPEFLGAGDAHELTTNLKANQDDRAQIRVLNEFFAARAEKSTESTRRIRKVLEHIHLRKGGVSVHELEEFGHYEKKTLQRHFKRMVGITPKAYCKIYRFRCLMNLIQSRPDLTWAELTDQAGFYDQAHMSRSVRDYLKVSPSSIVRLDMKLINYLLTR